MSDSKPRGDGKRELVEPTEGDKRYADRDGDGKFTHQVDVGRSHAEDQRHDAENESTPGRGDQGDRDS